MKKLFFLFSIFAIVLSCSSDETSTPVTPPPAPIVKYTITLSAGEGGTVSTTGGEYEAGQTVSVTATPQGEYLFKDWSDGNTNATRTITVSSNSTLTANFEKKKYPLTVNIEGEGEVLEEIVNAGRTTDYDSGTTVKLTAIPAEDGWEFSGWTGAIESDDNPVNLLVSQAQSVTAVFNDDLKQSVVGKWDFETSSASGKGNQTANGSNCTVLSIIFNTDMTFKMYVGNIVLFGDFSISNNSIELKIEDKSIGLISQISIEGSSLSATFNLNGYCVSVNVAQKVEDYNNGKTYMPDDTFEQIMIDAGIDDILDNYVLTEKLKTIKVFRHWRNDTYIEFLDGNTYRRIFEENERYSSRNGRNDINGLDLFSVNPGNTYKFISNVAGLEDFENLESFQMFVNKINEVDFSKNTKLYFYGLAYGTSDFKIKLPNPMPNELSIYIADFKWDSTTLDLSGDLFKANKLMYVYNFQPIEGYSTFVENFQGLSNIQANDLGFFGQHLTSLDVDLLNKDIVNIELQNNLLEDIDLTSLDKLEGIYIGDNPLKRIDLSKFNNLKILEIPLTQIDELDLSNQDILERIIAVDNPNLFCIKLNNEQLDFLNEKLTLNEDENYNNYTNENISWVKDKQASFRNNCQNNGVVSFDLNENIFPIPEYIDFKHIYFTLSPGRNAYQSVENFKKLIYLKNDSGVVVDSLLYDPRVEKNINIPLPPKEGNYFYDEVTYYDGETSSPQMKIIEWRDSNLSSSNRLEYKIYSDVFNYPNEQPTIKVKYNHDALLISKDFNVKKISVATGGFNTNVPYLYLNSKIDEYPIQITYDEYYIQKKIKVDKNTITEINLTGSEVQIPILNIQSISYDGGAYTVSDELNSAYSSLRSTGTAGHGGYFSLQSVSSDEMVVTQKGGDWYDGGIWLDIHKHTQTANNGVIKDTWNGSYNAISQVNNSIKNGNLNANLMAQAKVLRAYFHWRLLDLYGRIRYVDENGASPQLTRAEGFARIEGDILSALGISSVSAGMDLSGSALNTADIKYRINQFGALGILAKLYLNAEVYTGTARWQEAHDASDYIISNGSYRLSDSSVSVPNPSKRPAVPSDAENLTGYAAVFSPANYDNPEIIWSVEYNESDARGMNFHQMSLNYASQYTYLFQDQPWNGYAALEEFYNSYEDGDARKKSNFIVGEQTDYVGNPIYEYNDITSYGELNHKSSINELEPNSNRSDGARLGKFSFKIGAKPDLENDYPIVRLGDIFLMRAEAKARAAGNWSLALGDVNTIRARSGVGSLGSLDANSFLAERGREMFMESSRRTDLIRFGKWNNAWWEKTNSDAYRIVMPIPSDAIQNSNGELTQNPGY